MLFVFLCGLYIRKEMGFIARVLLTKVVLASMVIQTGSVTQAESDYVIDTLVVVDEDMYYRWKSYLSPEVTDRADISAAITQYVALVVHQANKRLATINRHAPFGIRLQVVDVQIDKPVLQYVPAGLLTRRINADLALDTFQKWVAKENLAAKYDHALLLTGKPMESAYEGSAQGAVAGRAYVGTVCDQTGRSVSVVQDLGGFQSVHFVAHEVAHSLGALHDGEPGADDCSETDQYLMAAVRSDGESGNVSHHPWYLSSCSAEAISNVFDNVTSSDSPLPEFTAAAALVPGQIYDATEQCRMQYGPNSRLCLGKSFSGVDGICTRMYCSTSPVQCAEHYAAEGTSCGNKKWCHMGQCVDSEEAPQMSGCPYGDTALLLGGGSSCTDYIRRYPSACYNGEIREACCQSCAEIQTTNKVCPYGDKRTGCTPGVCDQVYPNGTLLADLCCGTCNYSVTAACRDVADVDGFTCHERVKTYGKQECYNGTVAFHCCRTCSKQRLDIKGCEYGNLIMGGYCATEVRNDNSPCNRRLTALCCLTCDPYFRRKNDGDPNTGTPAALLSVVLICFQLLCLQNLRINQ